LSDERLQTIVDPGPQLAAFIAAGHFEGSALRIQIRTRPLWLEWQQTLRGNLEGVVNLALCYEKGIGVEVNEKKAFSLYKLGDPWAQCNLGVAYLEGMVTKENLTEGIKWIQKAARQGDAKAQYNLGRAYRDGEGVKKNTRPARI
jgi:TPR repeat protein